MRLHFLDISIVIAYLAICVIIALYRAPRIKTPRQFALGYTNISTSLLVCIIFASITGGGTIIGYTGKLYSQGLIFLVGLLFTPLFWFVSARIFAQRIEQFKGCISITQIMHKLYGSPGRWVTNIVSIIMSIGVISVQAGAIGYVVKYFFNIDTIYGIFLCYTILTVYSALGGIRAIVITEVFQFSVFFFMIPVSYVIALTKIGGLQDLTQKLPPSHLSFELTTTNVAFLSSFMIYALLPACHSPLVQRYLMAPNSKQLRQSLTTIGLITIPFTLSICLIAYIIKSLSPNVPTEEVFLFYISDYLPLGLKGLMVAGVIGAIMAVAESWLNSASVILVNDIIKVFKPDMGNKTQLFALRATIFILAIISTSCTYYLYGNEDIPITDLIWYMENFWYPLILIPICSGFLGFKTSIKAFIASTILAMVFTGTGYFVAGGLEMVSLCLGIFGSAIGLFGMHYLETLDNRIHIQRTLFQLLQNLIQKIKSLTTIITNLVNRLIKHVKFAPSPRETDYQKFTTFTLVYYFIYTLNLTADRAHMILASLLVIGYLLCFILLLRDIIFIKQTLKKYLLKYWHFTLIFCLPLVSSYMLFVSKGDDFWIINGLLSAFSLYFFVDALRFLVFLSIGTIGGYFLFLFSGSEFELLSAHNTIRNIGYIYLFFLLASLIFFRGREREQEEKVATMQMLGGAIAHEVKTPISAMSMCAQAINDILGKAIGKAKIIDNNAYTITIDKEEYNFLMTINKSVLNLTTQGINVVDGILTSLRNSVIEDEKKVYPINQIIHQTVNEYRALNEQAKNIEINIKNNFKIKCSKHYLKHVIFNLIKNSYRHGGDNVRIKISTSKQKIHFKDFGKGINHEDLPYIFNRFYTKSKSGTGIGLAFCKMVMEDLGGSIECTSELGKYTEFILTFPIPNTQVA